MDYSQQIFLPLYTAYTNKDTNNYQLEILAKNWLLFKISTLIKQLNLFISY